MLNCKWNKYTPVMEYLGYPNWKYTMGTDIFFFVSRQQLFGQIKIVEIIFSWIQKWKCNCILHETLGVMEFCGYPNWKYTTQNIKYKIIIYPR